MLKHGRAGVPMEVMGLMLGKFYFDSCNIPPSKIVQFIMDAFVFDFQVNSLTITPFK